MLFPYVCGKKQGENLLSETRSKPYGILGKTDDMQNLHKGLNDDIRNEKSLTQQVSRPNFSSNVLFRKDAVSNQRKMPNNLSKMVKSKVLQKDDQSVSMRTMKKAAPPQKAASLRPMKTVAPQRVPDDNLTSSETAEMENR